MLDDVSVVIVISSSLVVVEPISRLDNTEATEATVLLDVSVVDMGGY